MTVLHNATLIDGTRSAAPQRAIIDHPERPHRRSRRAATATVLAPPGGNGPSISPASSSRRASSTATAMSGRRRATRSSGNTRSTASPPRPACISTRTTCRVQGEAEGRRPARRAHPHSHIPLHVGAVQPARRTRRRRKAAPRSTRSPARAPTSQGLDRRPGRPPSEAHAGVHRRGDGPGEEARQDHRMSHIVELADARQMVDQGVNMLVHNVRDQEIPDDFIATLKAKNVSVISTLAREEGMFIHGAGRTARRSPTIRSSTRGLPRSRCRAQQEARGARQRSGAAALARMFDTDKMNLKKLVDDGINRLWHRFRRRVRPLLRAGLFRAPADGADARRGALRRCRSS